MEDQSAESLIISCNEVAMEHLGKENPRAALHLLRRAQELLSMPFDSSLKQKLQALTLRNLGSYYKTQNQPSHALHHLSKALSLTPTSAYSDLANTHLNISSVRSTLDQHEVALNHVSQAIDLFLSLEAIEPKIETKRALAIAYHNAGIEHKLLGNRERALQMFEFGLTIADRHLGNHPITDSLKRSLAGKFDISNKNNLEPKNLKSSLLTNSRKYVFERNKTPKNSLPMIRRTPRSQVSSRNHPTKISRAESRGKSSGIKRPLPRPENLFGRKSAQYGPPIRNEHFLAKKKACVVIQRFARGFLTRLRLKRNKTSMKAKNAIEALEALKKEVINDSFNFNIVNPDFKAVICIQKTFRKFIAIKNADKILYLGKRNSIIRIQKAVRGFLVKKRFLKVRRAAVFIQSHFRMQGIKSLYQRIYAAILHIQRSWKIYKNKNN